VSGENRTAARQGFGHSRKKTRPGCIRKRRFSVTERLKAPAWTAGAFGDAHHSFKGTEMNVRLKGALLALGLSIAMPAFAVVTVGGAPMYPNRDIVDNAVNSADHTTLLAAVKAAGLVDTLRGRGPFTVFAPVNAAFAALPPGTVDNLLKPENKPMLVKVLTLHVVPGKVDSAALQRMIAQGHGKAMLKTVEGETLTATLIGGVPTIADGKGDVAHVTIADVYQSNGVIHVIDRVLLPR